MTRAPRAEPTARERRELVWFAERLAEIHASENARGEGPGLDFWIRAAERDLSLVTGDPDQERDRIFYAALLRRLRRLRRQRRRRALIGRFITRRTSRP